MSGFFGATVDQSAWTAFTPVITSNGGTLTTASGAGLYKKIGRTVFWQMAVTITTNGSGSGYIKATLGSAPTPSTGQNLAGAGQDVAVSSKMLMAVLTSNVDNIVRIYNYDGSYPAANGAILCVSGFYQTAS